jgi:hypothetical protein
MTWNVLGLLCSGRELILSNLLAVNKSDIMVVTEAKVPSDLHDNFTVEGYAS